MDQTLARTSQRIATWMEDTALPFLDAYLPHDVCMLALSRGDDPTPTASTPNARLPRAWILDSNRKSYVDFAAPLAEQAPADRHPSPARPLPGRALGRVGQRSAPCRPP